MGEQGTFGHGPEPGVHILVGQWQPLIGVAIGVGLHHRLDFGLAPQTMVLQVGDGTQRVGNDMTVGRQDESHLHLGALGRQHVQRMQVVAHMAIRRVNHRGTAVQNVVTGKEQSVLFQQQAHMVGRVAWCKDHTQTMGFAI